MDVFLLLLGFTLLKMALGLALVWQGLRSEERPGGEDWWRGGGPPQAPRLPPGRRREARRARERRRPHARPARRATARVS